MTSLFVTNRALTVVDASAITPQDVREGVGLGVEEIDQEGFELAVETCFGPPSITNGTNRARNNRPFRIPAAPLAYTVRDLQYPPIDSGKIYGDGTLATSIRNPDAGGAIFKFNGLARSSISDLHLQCSIGTGVCVDVDWSSGGIAPASQSNEFSRVYTEGGGHGWKIAKSGFQVSELLWRACNFTLHSVKGIESLAQNAVLLNVLAGNMSGCKKGFVGSSGGFSSIIGTAIQNQNAQGTDDFDVEQLSSAYDAIFLAGVRSESRNFANFDNGIVAVVTGCRQQGPNAVSTETFVRSNAPVVISGGASRYGKVDVRGPTTANSRQRGVTINRTKFGRSDWLDLSNLAAGGVVKVLDVSFALNTVEDYVDDVRWERIAGNLVSTVPTRT